MNPRKIILLGAAMLTAAFRAFGGEDLVREFLSGLPGGFITKFVVVMAVIFVLGGEVAKVYGQRSVMRRQRVMFDQV